ncbi:MAG: FAD-dependent oxidoreductase, partial [Rickettsiaceae bacterium]|nr:FAD-dependent oxidoreductase [Rickettsiaceae bacterium]
SSLFSRPEELDFEDLINPSAPTRDPLDDAHYCIKCHQTSKDYCSKGFVEKSDPNHYKTNKLGNILKGCPLDIKISEMIELYSRGLSVAALIVAMEANPLLALTGARICNDCSKSCIYQKQRPVDVPLIETSLLEDVMSLDYGFEIYYILTNWNPLSSSKKNIDNKNKPNILVVGSGPAGISLAHYLLQNNCRVDIIEGQKIEALGSEFISSKIKDFSCVENYYELIKPNGFGGICEYGITDRWKKSKLLAVRICLERNINFRVFGGVKFGSTITLEDAKNFGYHHVALALGAGAPYLPKLGNIASTTGVYTASDFLMFSSLIDIESNPNAHFYINLPLYIIGGGLTSIDAGTQAVKYFIKLSKKLALKSNANITTVSESGSVKLLKKAGLFFLEEEEKAKQENRPPYYKNILQDLGGVNLCYRGEIKNSPAYRLNHEEIVFCLEEGVNIIENIEIIEILKDQLGQISSLRVKKDIKEEIVPCGTLLIASGTNHIEYDAKNYTTKFSLDSPERGTETQNKDHFISLWGDMLKEYEGSVVKAIQSVKDNYQKILENLDYSKAYTSQAPSIGAEAHIVDKKFISTNLFELKIKSPISAARYKSGQFFRLMSFSNNMLDKMEPLAISCSSINGDILGFHIEIVGNTTNAASRLHISEKVNLMGPLGGNYKIEPEKRYLIIAENIAGFSMAELANQLKKQNLYYDFYLIYNGEYYKHINEFSATYKIIFEADINNIHFKAIKYDYVYVNGSCEFLNSVYCRLANMDAEKYFSANTQMQCMMGGVCGRCIIQCEDGIKFACLNHIQPLERVTITSIARRLGGPA